MADLVSKPPIPDPIVPVDQKPVLSSVAQKPVTVTEDQQSAVYDQWTIASIDIQINQDGTIPLTLGFALADLSDPANPKQFPGKVATMGIVDISADPDLAKSTTVFFNAIMAKAVAQGVIS